MRLYSTPLHRFTVPANAAFPDGLTVARPVLRLSIESPNHRVTCHAILDTGADFCTFPMRVAEQLHLDVKRMPTAQLGGLGSLAVPTHFGNVDVDLQGITRYTLYAGFTEGLDYWGVAVLGQHGFFDRFDVIFRAREGVFDIAI